MVTVVVIEVSLKFQSLFLLINDESIEACYFWGFLLVFFFMDIFISTFVFVFVDFLIFKRDTILFSLGFDSFN